jgi:hypothetical protein
LRLPNLIDLEGQTVHLECPWCGLPYSLLNGIYGQFYGCLQFKQCGGGTGVGLAQMSRLRNGLGDSVVDHGVESKAEDDINLSFSFKQNLYSAYHSIEDRVLGGYT